MTSVGDAGNAVKANKASLIKMNIDYLRLMHQLLINLKQLISIIIQKELPTKLNIFLGKTGMALGQRI